MEKNIDWAIKKLKEIAKESHLKNQPHLDLTLADAQQRHTYMEALVIARECIANGELTEDQLKEKIGLI